MAALAFCRSRALVAALAEFSPYADVLATLAGPASSSAMGMLTDVRSVVPAGFSSGGSGSWFAGDVTAAFSLGPFVSQAASSTLAPNGLELSSLRSGLFLAGGTAAGAVVWFTAADKTHVTKTDAAEDGAQPTPPPPTPPPPTPPSGGNGKGGIGDEEKQVFINLLIELLNHLKRLLDSKDSGKEADLLKKKTQSVDVDTKSLSETKELVEALLAELKEGEGVHQLIPLVRKLGQDLVTMERKILAQTQEKKHLVKAVFEKVLKEDSIWYIVYDLVEAVCDLIAFFQGKIMFVLGVLACIYSGVYPPEIGKLTIRFLEDIIAEKRDKIKKLKDGKEDVDAGKLLTEIKEHMELMKTVDMKDLKEQVKVLQETTQEILANASPEQK